MSRRLWVIAIIIFIAVAAVIALAFVANLGNVPALAVIVLACIALAVVALQYLVVNPALIEAAKESARMYCEAGEIIDPSLNKRLCDRLARAPNDPEAVRLQEKLKELQQKK
jgi:hypothetical protein